jgi:hypothetical protein
MRQLAGLEGPFLVVFGMREVKKRVKKGVKWDGLLAPFLCRGRDKY